MEAGFFLLLRHKPRRAVLSLPVWHGNADVVGHLVCICLIGTLRTYEIHGAEQNYKRFQQKKQLSELLLFEQITDERREIHQICREFSSCQHVIQHICEKQSRDTAENKDENADRNAIAYFFVQ